MSTEESIFALMNIVKNQSRDIETMANFVHKKSSDIELLQKEVERLTRENSALKEGLGSVEVQVRCLRLR